MSSLRSFRGLVPELSEQLKSWTSNLRYSGESDDVRLIRPQVKGRSTTNLFDPSSVFEVHYFLAEVDRGGLNRSAWRPPVIYATVCIAVSVHNQRSPI